MSIHLMISAPPCSPGTASTLRSASVGELPETLEFVGKTGQTGAKIQSRYKKYTLCFELKMTLIFGVAVISAKKHKRQRRKRQSVTAKREKSQTPKVLTAILT